MRKSHQGGPVISISRNHSMIEPLENRQMLSASLVRGVLKVGGTAAADTITVDLQGTKQIRVSDGISTKLFARNKVTSISISAGDGDDTITIGSGIKQQVNINAGDGNDTVQGGTGREVISGGAGADTLFGGGGSDWIAGGDGGDLIEGDDGNDYLYGDAGDDTLNGGAGNDVMAGDLENTLVTKGAPPNAVGNDHLNGGDGNDWMISERRITGVDSLNRWEFQTNGVDVFTGGNGADVIDIGAPDVDGHQDDVITDKASEDFVPMTDARPFSENGTTDVHKHVLLQIKVKKGRGYKNMLVQPNIGFFAPHFLSGLHTHDTTGIIHFEAPAGSPSYKMGEFFRNWGITMDSGHIGRFLPPAGKKVTMLVTRGASSSFSNGKWIIRGGRVLKSSKFGGFAPVGDSATGVPPSGAMHGDVVEFRVG